MTSRTTTGGQETDGALPPAPDLLRDLPRQVVPIDELMDALSPRERLEDPEHVRLLAEAESVHPLLVHRPTMRVIDGVHRLRAAVLKGQTEVTVQTFDGSEADAFVLAVELNIRHGLPLTLRERKAAAERIIGSHPNWSDRAIAERTGLSAKTVSKARREAVGTGPDPGTRIGRDGRARPVSSVEGRRCAAALIAANPQMSLRELSRKTGVSVGTVRDVRERLRRGRDPIPDRLRATAAGPARPGPVCTEPVPLRARGAGPGPPARPGGPTGPGGPAGAGGGPGGPAGPGGDPATGPVVVQHLLRDPSLRATESGRKLLRLLLATELNRSELAEIAGAVPAHCAPLVRAIALRRAGDWWQLAGQVAEKPR